MQSGNEQAPETRNTIADTIRPNGIIRNLFLSLQNRNYGRLVHSYRGQTQKNLAVMS